MKRPGKSPSQRSREHLEAAGYHVELVEQNRAVGTKRWKVDLWGFIDFLCIRKDEVLAVQVTSASNVSSRVRKIEASPLLPRVREAGIRIVVHGWKAAAPSKAGAAEWTLREIDLS
jgi:hypothetical protein